VKRTVDVTDIPTLQPSASRTQSPLPIPLR